MLLCFSFLTIQPAGICFLEVFVYLHSKSLLVRTYFCQFIFLVVLNVLLLFLSVSSLQFDGLLH
jgi:hypothetical protein